ncbi:MAG: hypothetical protein JSS05_02350 [Proteobacteria bacterium]|nr:hypothetical protein [Pseudomonadota bacterium]
MSDFPAPSVNPSPGASPNESDVQVTHVTYALYALGLLTGGLGALAGLIVAYIKRDDVAGTYLRSHMDWLIRTFWWSLLWGALVVVFVFVTLFIGAFVAWIPLGILWLWGLYRVIKGWLRLADKRAVG